MGLSNGGNPFLAAFINHHHLKQLGQAHIHVFIPWRCLFWSVFTWKRYSRFIVPPHLLINNWQCFLSKFRNSFPMSLGSKIKACADAARLLERPRHGNILQLSVWI